MTAALYLAVGLGNPGISYRHTRHSVGHRWLDACIDQYSFPPLKAKKHCLADVSSAKLDQVTVILARPTTFMNESGRAVQALCHFYRIHPSQLLIIHDELDFPVETIRLKHGGGHGGHNGLRSIITCTGLRQFMRLRIGIGRSAQQAVSQYVLSRATPEEQLCIDHNIAQSLPLLPLLAMGDWQTACQRLHQPHPGEPYA